MDSQPTKKMIVREIKVEPNRVLLYSDGSGHHAIADIPHGLNVHLGDEIKYEPYGVNFGWHVPEN